MKNICNFAATSILDGGKYRPVCNGLFLCPAANNMRFRTPVWCFNEPTAVKVEVNGKGGAVFYFSQNKKNLSVMTSTEKQRLKGKTIPQSNTSAHETGTSDLVSSALMESMSKLREIRKSIDTFWEQNPSLEDIAIEKYICFDNEIGNAAYNLSEIIRAEFMENFFYKN
jgi:hypothetical protein